MNGDIIGKCCICDREMIEGTRINEHHLIPKAKGGMHGEKITIHEICHNKIHSIWTESELAGYYYTPDRIKDNKEMIKFVKWLKRKPLDFYVKTKLASHRKRRK